MNECKRIHRKAMEHAEIALLAKTKKDYETAIKHSQTAFELETQALDLAGEEEPTRTILKESCLAILDDLEILIDLQEEGWWDDE